MSERERENGEGRVGLCVLCCAGGWIGCDWLISSCVRVWFDVSLLRSIGDVTSLFLGCCGGGLEISTYVR